MVISNAGCCAAVLNQQHQQNVEHCVQGCQDQALNGKHKADGRYTVIENGRVVVKQKSSRESAS